MINLLLGAPGGGKSYEAVAFHVLPALKAGRKVVTNLPLDVEAFGQLDPDYPDLIEIRDVTLAVKPAEPDMVPARMVFGRPVGLTEKPWVNRAFSHVEDFADEWRHPKTGVGVLYVVDECHMPMPVRGTEIAVEEWFSMHRHYNVDVLLISQSHAKVSKSIVDLVQVVYRVRKAVAFGSMSKYIRKVQDGIKGDVTNTSIREYKAKYQKLYRSHTHGRALDEVNANDIVPIWRRWPFIGAAVCLVFVVAMVSSGKAKSPLSQGTAIINGQGGAVASTTVQAAPVAPGSFQVNTGPAKPAEPEPFGSRGLHLVGEISSGTGRRGIFSISQNGQHLRFIRSGDLEGAGYVVKMTGACSAVLTWNGQPRSVICDSPSVSPVPGGGVSSGKST